MQPTHDPALTTIPASDRRALGQASSLVKLTDWCLRHGSVVLAAWLAAAVLGVVGALHLAPLLGTGFSLPGTDSSRVSQIVARDFGRGSQGDFVLIVTGRRPLLQARRAAKSATRFLPGARVASTELLPSGSAAAFLRTTLTGAQAEARTALLRQRLGTGVLVTGDAAVQHDVGPALERALEVGELYLAVPAALLILLLVFGTGSALLPFGFAAFTIPPALGIAWAVAHVLELSDYLLNMVMMIGLGIAIDYSLLVVNRYRDERRRGHEHREAVRETMVHAGRTIVFSGLVVSLGLALMLLLPVPFLRGFGVGGLLVPVISILCALTLLPVMLLAAGERLERIRFFPRLLAERRHVLELRLWAAHAGWVMKRARYVAPLVALLLVVAALPLIGIHVGPSSTRTLPQGLASVQRARRSCRRPAAATRPTRPRSSSTRTAAARARRRPGPSRRSTGSCTPTRRWRASRPLTPTPTAATSGSRSSAAPTRPARRRSRSPTTSAAS